jgi:hypothetical protein
MGGGFIQIIQESGPPRENRIIGNIWQKSRNVKVKLLKGKMPYLTLYDNDDNDDADEDDYLN